MDLSVIIVNYKTRGLVRQTLKSLRAAGVLLNYEVLVVDNSPGDGLSDVVRSEFPETRLIALGANVGFARANNLAIRQSKGAYVLILNPDVMIEPGAIEAMFTHMEAHREIGLLAPMLVHPDGTRQESVHHFPTPWIPVYRRTPLGRLARARKALDRYFMHGEVRETPMPVDWAEGAAMFVRRKAIDAVGMFDERFFVYFEDADWCRRFWLKGWKVVYLPSAKILHYHRRESADAPWWRAAFLNKVARIHITSALKYFLKWRGEKLPR